MNFLKNHRVTGYVLAAASVFLPLASITQQKPQNTSNYGMEAPAPDPGSSPEVNQAETAMGKHDFATAEALLQKAVDAKPDDSRAWLDLGYIYEKSMRGGKAVDAFRKSIAAKPDVFESNLELGILLAQQGKSDEAAKYLKAAIQLKPRAHPQESQFRALMALGWVLMDFEPTEALSDFAEASKLKPHDPQPLVNAGKTFERNAYRRLDTDSTTESIFESAATEYKAALDLDPNLADPNSLDALLGLDRVYEQQKKYAEAEIWLRKLAALKPQYRLYLGKVLAAQGKYDEAEQQLKSEVSENPGDTFSALELARVYAKAGKDPEAEQQFRIVVATQPQNAEAHYLFGSFLIREMNYPEAQQELRTAVKLKRDLIDAYGDLAEAAAANKDYTFALQVLDDRAKMQADPPAVCFLRATIYDNLNVVPQAVEYYQRFLASDDGKFPDQEWQARHRLMALDPKHADNYRVKK
jgi:tetratricopeptide (TPR) repeat protein